MHLLNFVNQQEAFEAAEDSEEALHDIRPHFAYPVDPNLC